MGSLQSCGLSTSRIWFLRFPLQCFSRYYRALMLLLTLWFHSYRTPGNGFVKMCAGISESYRPLQEALCSYNLFRSFCIRIRAFELLYPFKLGDQENLEVDEYLPSVLRDSTRTMPVTGFEINAFVTLSRKISGGFKICFSCLGSFPRWSIQSSGYLRVVPSKNRQDLME